MTDDIYFDNASTSYPKPLLILDAISSYMKDAGCSPGRSGHQRARRSQELIDHARKQIAEFLGCKEYRNISYTYNATYALNLIIKGYLRAGDHVVTTCLGHNSVLRPLEKLKRQSKIDYTVIGLDGSGLIDIGAYRNAFLPNTKMVAITHASNVIGIINPIEKLIDIAHRKNVKVLVDLSQTAGFLDISLEKCGADFAAFTSHKSLLGLPGVGGIYAQDDSDLDTIIEGGTGGNSVSLVQPGYSPDKFEAGTCNYTGIIALEAATGCLLDIGLDKIRQHERKLLTYVTNGLRAMDGLTLYGDIDIEDKVPVLSFNISGMPANEVSTILDNQYGIMTRPGLQCAPLAHKTIATSPAGTVRVSFGFHNTIKECDTLIQAVKDIKRK